MAARARSSRRLTLAAGAMLSLLLCSCSGQDDPVAEQTPSATTSAAPSAAATSAPTTSSAVPLNAEDQAVLEATEAVREFRATVDRINADPNSDADTLHDVTTGDAYLEQVRMAVQSKARGLIQTGSVRVVDATPVSIDLTTDTAIKPPKFPTVVLDTCIDVSGTQVVDAEGKSAVVATRQDQVSERLHVVHFDFGWRVHQIESKGEPC